MIPVLAHAPADNDAFRRSLYGGAVVLVEPTPASRQLVAAVAEQIRAEFADVGEPREAQFHLDDAEFFRRAGRLRKHFFIAPALHDLLRGVLSSCGFDPARTAYDPLKLRVVSHRGHENPRAAAIYHAHRDTWYANPQSQITWWIPIHDVTAEETFVFYPDWFTRPLPNNSEVFDYERWTAGGMDLRIGWQRRDAGTTETYPGLSEPFEAGTTWTFSARAGQILLFAGAQFHQTRRQATGRTRFSVDFRTADLLDESDGVGAPNVDNRSRGSALRDYVRSAACGLAGSAR